MNVSLSMLREAVASELYSFHDGTITAPGATSFIDEELIDSVGSDEEYVGAWVLVTEAGSPAEGVIRRVSAYDAATGQLTISRPWAPAPAADDDYELHTLLSPDDLEQCIAVGMGKCHYIDRWILEAVADQREYALPAPSALVYNWIEHVDGVRDVFWCAEATHLFDTTIAFAVTTPGTITDTNNDLAQFETGDVIEVRGSASNDGRYTVSTGGVAGTIRTTEATVLEAAGQRVSILALGPTAYQPLRWWKVTESAGVFSLHVQPSTSIDGVYAVDILRRYATLSNDTDTTTCPIFWAVAAGVVEAYRLLSRKDPAQDSTRFKQAQVEAMATLVGLSRRYQPRPKVRVQLPQTPWVV